jgi:hypothetical protein
MRNLTMLVLVLLGMLAGVANAGFQTGNDLYAKCKAPEGSLDSVYCVAYIAAVFDSLEAGFVAGERGIEVCTPDNIQLGQARDIVARYLTDHPEWRTSPAYYLAADALMRAWPCKGKK